MFVIGDVVALGPACGVLVVAVCCAAALAARAHPGRGPGHRRAQVAALSMAVAIASLPFVPGFSLSVASAASATSARSFTDSVCVATHLHYSNTPYYRRWPEVRDALVNARIRHVRDTQLPSTVWSYATVAARWQQLASAGVRATLGPPHDAGFADAVARAAANPAVEATEGANELDQTGVGWQARLRNTQIGLWNETRKYANLSWRPVLVGSLAFTSRWSQVTDDLTPYFTRGNIHPYPGGQTPDSNLTSQFDVAKPHFGGRYIWATETGYQNAVNAPLTEGHKPTSERAQGIYAPQLYLDYYRRGITRTCMYEFLDEWADPAKDARESNFGLLRNDLSPKPAYTHVARLLELLSDPTPRTPGALSFTIWGPTTLRSKLFQKGDGSFWLALWNDVSVWDPVSRTDRYPADAAAWLSFGSRRAWSIYDIRRGTAPTGRGTGSSLRLSVPVIPLLVRVA
jgi:hypothetical protein